MRGLVRSHEVEARVDELADAALQLVADPAHLFERLSGRVVDVPVLDRAGDIGAGRLAVQRDRPVGVELHLAVELPRAAVGDVDSDLAHRFDDVRPDRGRGLLAGRLGAEVGGGVALEEGLRDL